MNAQPTNDTAASAGVGGTRGRGGADGGGGEASGAATADLLAALKDGTANVMVCYTRCWPCQFDDHFDPPEIHTWMDEDDAEHAGLSWPLDEPDAPGRRCGCHCAKPTGATQ